MKEKEVFKTERTVEGRSRCPKPRRRGKTVTALSAGFELEAEARAVAARPPSSRGPAVLAPAWYGCEPWTCLVTLVTASRVASPPFRGGAEGSRTNAPRGDAVAQIVHSRFLSVLSVCAVRVEAGAGCREYTLLRVVTFAQLFKKYLSKATFGLEVSSSCS